VRNRRECALRKRAPLSALCAVCGLLLLAACTGDGIFPTTGLPPAPPGPPPPYPTFSPTGPSAADERLLTTPEREALETQLNKLGSDREAGVRRRIEKTK
jgi:hypothetical protein